MTKIGTEKAYMYGRDFKIERETVRSGNYSDISS